MAYIADYRIVISAHATANERRAASFIRENVKLVCGKKLRIVTDAEVPTSYEIVVGRTSREIADGLTLHRSREGIWEYEIHKIGTRLYLSGLGCAPAEEPPYNTAYRKLDDGCVGTVFAAYHVVEDILGYDFIYAPFDEFPERENLEMPEAYDYAFTREAFRKQLPEKLDGTAMYFLQGSERLDWNGQCFVFQTKEGKLIVFDGGYPEEAERLIRVLQMLSGEEIPTVSAWFLSHLHVDHYGVYCRLCTDENLRRQLKVERFYCNLLSEEFYVKTCREAASLYAIPRATCLESGNTVGAEVVTVQTGDVIRIDELSFEILHVPDEAYGADMNINDSSVVCRLVTEEGQSILFLGDAEFVCSNDLLLNHREQLRSDVVQVGHHGCGNVSRECYEAIGARAYLWPVGEKFWYGESGEGLNTHNVGVARYRTHMKELGVDPRDVYVNMDRIMAFPLPMKIYGDNKE